MIFGIVPKQKYVEIYYVLTLTFLLKNLMLKNRSMNFPKIKNIQFKKQNMTNSRELPLCSLPGTAFYQGYLPSWVFIPLVSFACFFLLYCIVRNWVNQLCTSCIWLLSINIMFVRFILIVLCSYTFLLHIIIPLYE